MDAERQPAPEPASVAPAPVVSESAGPAPMAAPPVRRAASAARALGAAAAGSPPPLSPAQVLELQRTAGNQAVAGMLQRDDTPPEKTPVTGPADIEASGGEPVGEGTVTVSPLGNTKAHVLGPEVKFTGKAWLAPNKKLDSNLYVGFVQNLVRSDRGVVYRRGGVPDGEIVEDYHEGKRNRRDAVNSPEAEKEGRKEIHKGAVEPFYWPPGSIGDTNDSPERPVELNARDRPEFEMPIESNGGRITQVTGSDDFKLGIAVKKGDSVWNKTAWNWQVPWDVAVDASVNGAGKAIETEKVRNALRDGPDASLKDWSLTPNTSDVWEAFATEAEAMKRSPLELLQWVGTARTYDPVSHRNICAALEAKNPTFSVDVTCKETSDLVGRDQIHIKAGAGGDTYKSATVGLRAEESHKLTFTLAELFGSASAIGPGAAITVELTHADGPEASATLKFSGSKKLTVGSGSYEATLTVA